MVPASRQPPRAIHHSPSPPLLNPRATARLRQTVNPPPNLTHQHPIPSHHRLARPPCPSWLRSKQPRRDEAWKRAPSHLPPNQNNPHRGHRLPTKEPPTMVEVRKHPVKCQTPRHKHCFRSWKPSGTAEISSRGSEAQR